MKLKAINKVIRPSTEVDSVNVNGIKFEGSLSTTKVKGGLRDAFVCPPGYVWLTCDYSQQELRLIGNISGETNYINPIKEGKDIHNYIAKKMFDFEDPAHRTKVKTLNFACPTDECLIHTENGLVRPSELKTQVLDLDNKNVKILNNFPFKASAIRVHYDNGCVESYHVAHKVLTLNKNKTQWKEVRNLSLGDKVLYSIKPIKPDKEDGSPDKAYLLGLLYGKGIISDDCTFVLVNRDKKNKFIDCCKSLNIDFELFTAVTGENNEYNKYLVNLSSLSENITSLDKIDDIAYTSWTLSEIESFIEGLVDTIGSKNDKMIDLKFKNKLLISSISPLLNAYGFSTQYYVRNQIHHLQITRLDGDFSITTPILIESIGTQTCYCLEVEGHEYLTGVVSHNCNYGAAAPTIASKLKIPINEAQKLLDKFFATMTNLVRWRKEIMSEGRRKGIIFTLFGRPRLVYKYYQSSKSSDHAFGDRTCLNSPIQGEVSDRSRVLTDKGYLKVRDLANTVICDSTHKVPDLKVWNGEKFCEFGMFSHANDPISVLTLSDGSKVEYGKNHLIAVLENNKIVYKKAVELVPGDKVVKSLPNSVEFEGTDFTILDYLNAGYLYGTVSTEINTSLVLPAESIRILPTLKNLGIKAFYCIDDVIFKGNLSQRKAFLEGFLSSFQRENKPITEFYFHQERLALDFQLLLRTCGVLSKVSTSPNNVYKLSIQEISSLKELINSNYYYSEVVTNIKTNKTETAYCLCLWDESHCYEAEGMIHHNCSPLDGYLTLKNSVVPFKDVLAQRVEGRNNRVLIPSRRGSSEPLLVVFDTKDFAVVDFNHKFVTNSLKDPIEGKIRESLYLKGKPQKVIMEPRRKLTFNFSKNYFKSLDELRSLLLLTMLKDKEIKITDKIIPAALFRLALSHTWFTLNYRQIIRIRSLASLFGYRCIYSPKKDKFSIRFNHKKYGKLLMFKHLLDNESVPVGSCTVINGLNLYENQGVMNVNTGGDIIRLDHCKLKTLFDTDPEWKENVKYACTVHDEINLFVKQSYLYTAYHKLMDLMYFNIPQFKVPIEGEPGVGFDWGHIIDIKGNGIYIGEDNKIHIKEFETELSSN